MTNYGEMDFFLRVEVKQNEKGIFISQKNMQKRF